MLERRKRLRKLLKKDNILVIPGAYDAISARMVEKLGFDAVYMTGGGAVSYTHLTLPTICSV